MLGGDMRIRLRRGSGFGGLGDSSARSSAGPGRRAASVWGRGGGGCDPRMRIGCC